MSITDLAGLVTGIDQSIQDSDERIQDEIADYIETYPERVGEQIVACGRVRIPTFAGDYFLTEAQLREIAEDPHSKEAVA